MVQGKKDTQLSGTDPGPALPRERETTREGKTSDDDNSDIGKNNSNSNIGIVYYTHKHTLYNEPIVIVCCCCCARI